MSPWDVKVIKDDGDEDWLISELVRVFRNGNVKYAVECGDGSYGRLERNMVGKVLQERPEIVEEESRREYELIESFYKWLDKL